jgi:hypothetical protein
VRPSGIGFLGKNRRCDAGLPRGRCAGTDGRILRRSTVQTSGDPVAEVALFVKHREVGVAGSSTVAWNGIGCPATIGNRAARQKLMRSAVLVKRNHAEGHTYDSCNLRRFSVVPGGETRLVDRMARIPRRESTSDRSSWARRASVNGIRMGSKALSDGLGTGIGPPVPVPSHSAGGPATTTRSPPRCRTCVTGLEVELVAGSKRTYKCMRDRRTSCECSK